MPAGTLINFARAALSTRDLRAHLSLIRDSRAFTRLMFLHAACEAGLTQALSSPAQLDELATRTGAERPDLLEALLAVGVSVGELRLANGRYALRGRSIRALADPANDALAAMLDETVRYHASVYQQFAPRLRGAELGPYLDEFDTVIARSSRVIEPFMANFVRDIVPPRGPVRILEMGCGSGVYLRRAAERNPGATGIGVDLSSEVADATRARVAEWGLGSRFEIRAGDIRSLTPDAVDTFELVTSYNNIYYIPPEDRVGLFRHLRSMLRPGGRLALVSMFQGKSIAACNFDMALRSTLGCAPLPRLYELERQLGEAGFGAVRITRLAPTEPFYGVVASLDEPAPSRASG
jgi:SAM-dependent methyltransferase